MGFGEEITSELGACEQFNVISYYTTRKMVKQISDIRTSLSTLGADYVLTGSVRIFESKLHANVQLVSSETGTLTWAHSYDFAMRRSNPYELQSHIAKEVVVVVADKLGTRIR